MNTTRLVEVISESAVNYPHVTFSRKGKVYTCVNPYSYHLLRNQYDMYGQMDGLYVDGILMCKLINLFWRKSIPRLSFDMSGMAVDLFNHISAAKGKLSIFLIGAKQEELEKSIEQISKAYPAMKISGYRNGYFKDKEERIRIIHKITEINPDYTIVGMGSPLQEQFALDLRNAGYKGIVFTCGGFLHQTAKRIKYYPDWVNKYNLRAIYRLFHEKGLWKRLYNVLIQFPILFTYDTIKAKLHQKSI